MKVVENKGGKHEKGGGKKTSSKDGESGKQVGGGKEKCGLGDRQGGGKKMASRESEVGKHETEKVGGKKAASRDSEGGKGGKKVGGRAVEDGTGKKGQGREEVMIEEEGKEEQQGNHGNNHNEM